MKIELIHVIPKNGEGLIESEKYVRDTLRSETELAVSYIEHGFPSVESELHGMVNGAQVALLAKLARQNGADGIFVNCFDDPGVYACREFLRIPVFGAYQPAMLTALALSDRIGVLTTDSAGILSEERKARLSGFDKRVGRIRAVDMPVLSLAQKMDTLLERLLQACVDLHKEDGIGTIVLGCTAMHRVIVPLRQALKKKECPVTVIEPLQNGIKYLEHIIEQGYSNALHVLPEMTDWEV